MAHLYWLTPEGGIAKVEEYNFDKGFDDEQMARLNKAKPGEVWSRVQKEASPWQNEPPEPMWHRLYTYWTDQTKWGIGEPDGFSWQAATKPKILDLAEWVDS